MRVISTTGYNWTVKVNHKLGKKWNQHPQVELERQLNRSLKRTAVAGLIFCVNISFAVFTSKGMLGCSLWDVTRIPNTLVACVAVITFAASGASALWNANDLKRFAKDVSRKQK